MTTVGSFEAKTHLPQLLERVFRGERITITKHGRPVPSLWPLEVANILLVGERRGRISQADTATFPLTPGWRRGR